MVISPNSSRFMKYLTHDGKIKVTFAVIITKNGDNGHYYLNSDGVSSFSIIF